MKGVSLDGLHSYGDFGLYLLNENSCIPPPMPKTHFVKVPGRSGDLDLTEALTGRCEYENRIITLQFGGVKQDWPYFLDEFTNMYHGRKIQLVFDYDQDHFFTGRVSFRGDFEKTARIGKFTVDVECDPYRYSLSAYSATAALNGGSSTKTINISSEIPIVPEFTANITTGKSITVRYGTTTYALRNGTQVIPDISFEGSASLTFSGYGTVTVVARGGRL
jgi:phage-related protein